MLCSSSASPTPSIRAMSNSLSPPPSTQKQVNAPSTMEFLPLTVNFGWGHPQIDRYKSEAILRPTPNFLPPTPHHHEVHHTLSHPVPGCVCLQGPSRPLKTLQIYRRVNPPRSPIPIAHHSSSPIATKPQLDHPPKTHVHILAFGRKINDMDPPASSSVASFPHQCEVREVYIEYPKLHHSPASSPTPLPLPLPLQ